MNIPSIPTDNLYKFLALSGTVIVLLSIYMAETKINEVEDAILDESEMIKILAVKYAALEKRTDEIKSIIENSILRQKGLYKKDLGKLELEYSSLELKELLKELEETHLLLQIDKAKIESKNLIIKKLHERSITISRRGIMIIALGLIMTNIGFIFWYIKVQKPLDMVLQNEIYKKQI